MRCAKLIIASSALAWASAGSTADKSSAADLNWINDHQAAYLEAPASGKLRRVQSGPLRYNSEATASGSFFVGGQRPAPPEWAKGLPDGYVKLLKTLGVKAPANQSADKQELNLSPALLSMNEVSIRPVSKVAQRRMFERLLSSDPYQRESVSIGSPIPKGRVTSFYGWRSDPFRKKPKYHHGVDFAGHRGMPIQAVSDGEVIFAGWRRAYGRVVEIRHTDGFVTRYAHNQKNLVKVGQAVSQGDKIALMGSSGRATGPHLHLEVIQPGTNKATNPLNYVHLVEPSPSLLASRQRQRELRAEAPLVELDAVVLRGSSLASATQ